jgi:putative transposase
MPNYRRMPMPGGCWFFTVCLLDGRSTLLVDEIDLLRRCFRETREVLPFRIEAIVVLPDHLHTVWTLPPGDGDFSDRWRSLKGRFSHALPRTEWRSAVRLRRGERGIWQRRFWEHRIRDAEDYAHHVAYCHFDPVRHGLVDAPQEWPHSSIHRALRHGAAPCGVPQPIVGRCYGERPVGRTKSCALPAPHSR